MATDLEITREDISGGNLFMKCSKLNEAALTDLPQGYHIRTCRKEELDIWKARGITKPSSFLFNPYSFATGIIGSS